MPTIDITQKDLLKAVEQLNPHELQGFVEEVLSLRARRIAPVLSADETKLIEQINEGLPDETRKRFAHLDRKRKKNQITDPELQEYLQITEQAEQLSADRVRAVSALANLHKTSVATLVRKFGLKFPKHA